MRRNRIIRKILVLAVWALVLTGMTTLLVAANRKQKEHLCREVLVGIKGSGEKLYVEQDDILKLIEKSTGSTLVDRTITSIDLARLEKVLEKNTWIRDAELYFDSKDALHVFVEERKPIARIFSTYGSSFYIDSSGFKMPLLEKFSVRVPVFTGFPNPGHWRSSDSVLAVQVKRIAQFIDQHPFWNAQIGQVDILSDQTFELIPVVGDHVIRIGEAEKISEKLGRLYVFYKEVLSKVGFSKYAVLDVQYEGQVVAVKKGPVTAVDSVQLQKNIDALLMQATLQQVDNDMLPQSTADSNKDLTVSKPTSTNESVSTKTNPTPIKKPKAIMKPVRTE